VISRLFQILGLVCRISSLLYGSFAKETYNLVEYTSIHTLRAHATWATRRRLSSSTAFTSIYLLRRPIKISMCRLSESLQYLLHGTYANSHTLHTRQHIRTPYTPANNFRAPPPSYLYTFCVDLHK